MGNEKTYVENPIKQFLELRRLNGDRVFSFKQYQTGATIKGISDISACIDGIFVAIEVKDFGKKPSDEQNIFGESICRAGGIYVITDDYERFVGWYNMIKTFDIANHKGHKFDLTNGITERIK